jgi:hypothetical protein
MGNKPPTNRTGRKVTEQVSCWHRTEQNNKAARYHTVCIDEMSVGLIATHVIHGSFY